MRNSSDLLLTAISRPTRLALIKSTRHALKDLFATSWMHPRSGYQLGSDMQEVKLVPGMWHETSRRYRPYLAVPAGTMLTELKDRGELGAQASLGDDCSLLSGISLSFTYLLRAADAP